MASEFSTHAPQLRASTSAILEYAWDAGPFLTDDALAAVGLTKSTTISAIDELISVGLVKELPDSRADGTYRRGRPARRFMFNAYAGLLLGIDAGRAHITTTVANLAGETLHSQSYEVDSAEDTPSGRREAVSRTIDTGLKAVSGIDRDVITLAIGVPAPVNNAGDSPSHPEGFWQLMNPDFKRHFQDRFPRTRVENDAALAALAEGSQGAATDCDHYVSLLVGKRLGAGVVMDGRLIRGAHGGVGELKVLKYVEGVDGTRGLGRLIDRWVRQALAGGDLPTGHPLTLIPDEDLSARTELAHITADDPHTGAIHQRASRVLARICSLLASLYDPERIVVCGAVTEALNDIISTAERLQTSELQLPSPRIVASRLGGDVVSVGAVSAAQDTARGTALPLLTQRHMDTSEHG